MTNKQIIAMGGGGFSMEPDNQLLDAYIVSSCNKPNPVISLLPTASGDSDWLISRFYRAFNQLPCRPKHISLFRQSVDLEKQVMESDAIYVTGGNTRNMIAIWRASGMEQLLWEAWERGILLSGLSAGAICWFAEGHTDSTGALGRMDCLGMLPGSCCPHFDGEKERRDSYHEHLSERLLSQGIALDDGAAAHYIDTELQEVVTSQPKARAFQVKPLEDSIKEIPLPTRYLGEPIKTDDSEPPA